MKKIAIIGCGKIFSKHLIACPTDIFMYGKQILCVNANISNL